MALATKRKATTHQRKRLAKHHRHNKPYLKTYWPYLPMLGIVGIGLMINSLWAHPAVLGSTSNFTADTLLASTNSQRVAEHKSAFAINAQLSAAAQAKANDMVAHNYWAHSSPTGQTPWTFIAASGYQYQSAGENLAYGFSSAGDVVTGWMNSPEHRANILNPDYQNVGFGVAESPNYLGQGPELIVVAEYGQPAGAAGLTPAVQGAKTELTPQTVSRIQLLTGGHAAWATLAAIILAAAAWTIFVIRHAVWLRRLILEGESFVAHNPLLDILITLIFTAGFVLSRTTGLIR